MSSWSRQRRFVYGTSVIIIVGAIVVTSAWKLFYKAPTCFDGVQNGSEQGKDCGGACQKLCPSAFLTAAAQWIRFEKVAPGLYNVAAYVVNPNPDGEALHVPYHMQLYGDDGILITEYDGTLTLPPHRNTLAFKGALDVGERIPAKALFQFSAVPDWHKRQDPLASLSVLDKKYSEDDSGSSLQVTLKNTGAESLPGMTVFAILYDKNSNAIGFSKTIVDTIPGGGTKVAPFTWSSNRHGAVISIEVLPVAE